MRQLTSTALMKTAGVSGVVAFSRSSSTSSRSSSSGSHNARTYNGSTSSATTSPSQRNGAAILKSLLLCTALISSTLVSLYGATILTNTATITTPVFVPKEMYMNTGTGTPDRVRKMAFTTTTTNKVNHKSQPKKSILLTGGAGFVGSHIVEYLLMEQEYDIVLLDEMNDYYDINIKEANLQHLLNLQLEQQERQQRTQTAEPAAQLHIYRGDISDTTLLDIIFTHHTNIVSICHMAARAGVRPSIVNPYTYIQSNIVGTLTLLHYAYQHHVQNFVFASSSSVYGGSTSTYFTETEAVDHPISPYAATKKACELFAYVYSHQYNQNFTALRFFTVYGPRGRPDMAPYKFIHAISNQLPIQQHGDGTSSRDYTYVSDIVTGVVQSLIHYPSRYNIYNLGKGNGTSLKDFVQYVESFVGHNTTAIVQVLPDQAGDVPYTCANISKARTELHYQPQVSFPDGIQKTVLWYQQQHFIKEEKMVPVKSVKHRNKARRRLLSQPRSIGLVQDEPSQRRLLHTDTSTSSKSLPWPGSNKKIVVSGGISSNTMVGSHLIEALLSRGNDVILVDDHIKPIPSLRRITDIDARLATVSYSTLLYLQRKYNKRMKRDTKTWNRMGQLTVYLGNRTNSSFLENIFHQEQPTHVCHFGIDKPSVQTIHSLETSKLYVQKNIDIAVRLLEVSKYGSKMKTNGGKLDGILILNHKIENFVLMGTDSVYGSEAAKTRKVSFTHHFNHGPQFRSCGSKTSCVITIRNETDRVDHPKSSYGASMKAAELFGYTYNHLYHIPVSILRLFNVYGPRQIPTKGGSSFELFDTLMNFANMANVTATTSSLWDRFDFSSMDFTPVDDVVKGIVASIDRPFPYEIFNLGSGSRNCLDGKGGVVELIRNIATQMSLTNATTTWLLNEFRKSLVLQSNRLVDGISCSNIQKAKELLHYNPNSKMRLSDSVKRTIDWHQQQQEYSLLQLVDNNNLRPPTGIVTDVSNPKKYSFSNSPIVTDNLSTTLTSSVVVELHPTKVLVLLTNTVTSYPIWIQHFVLTQWLILVLFFLSFSLRFRPRSIHSTSSYTSPMSATYTIDRVSNLIGLPIDQSMIHTQ
jgi:UDP-glucuronate 4-epimerase